MDIDFSDIYAPLFDLLEAKSVVNDPKFDSKYNNELKVYWKNLANVDTVLLSGGRDSGKSYALSCFNPIAAAKYNHRVLYTRQTMASTDNSITEALEGRLELLGMNDLFRLANKTYDVKEGIGKISITGQKTSVGTQTAKLKSLENYSIFETDEGEELTSHKDWLKIKRSMRAKDVQCLSIIAFNPPTKNHWLYPTFYKGLPSGFNGIKNNVLYIHSTYLDNGEENMASHNWVEYESLRLKYDIYIKTPTSEREQLPKNVIDGYKSYKYDILGGFKLKAEGVVFTNWEIGEFEEVSKIVFGQDFGFSNDPTTLIQTSMDKKKKYIYLKENFCKTHLKTSSIGELNKLYASRGLIVGDSAEPRLIKELEQYCNIVPAIKGAGSITFGIALLQDYTLIVDPGSTNLIEELGNYIWLDKKTNTPCDKHNHLIDAARYAISYQLANPNRGNYSYSS